MVWGWVTNSMGLGDSQGWENGAMTTELNKANFELESATSPPIIELLSRMRYHWKALVFYCYVVRASYQFNGLWRPSRLRQWCHDNRTKQIEFWTWKCHISTTNRTPELNEVSLESSGIILLCWEGKLPIQWALETLKVKTKAPWQPKTKQNKFWTWKYHISTNNRTPESNEVSLEISCILLLCCEGESPIQWALETLKVETMVPWQHNQSNRILNLKVPHLHRQ
jgi:hypothetical protein